MNRRAPNAHAPTSDPVSLASESDMKALLSSTAVAVLLSVTPPAAANPVKSSDFVQAQTNGDWLTSELIGASVKNSAGKVLGDVNDVVVSRDGRTKAVVIGVGGFLGVGEKDVAVPKEKLTIAKDKDRNWIVTVTVSKAALDAAPEYKTYSGKSGGMIRKAREKAGEWAERAKDATQTAKKRVTGEKSK